MNKIAIAALAAFLTLAPAYAQTAQTDTPAAATQNTITTTAPVTSSTSISVGTLAGEVLTWAATAFGSVGAMVGTAFLIRLFKKAGLEGADLMSDQINKTLLNGLNDAAARITTATAGKGARASSQARINRLCPAAAAACFSSSTSFRRLIPRRRRPSATALDDTTTTDCPRARSLPISAANPASQR